MSVILDCRTHMECVESGCEEQLGVDLVLSIMGGFVFRPPKGHGWQIVQGDPAPVFECRCPRHHRMIEKLPGIVAPDGRVAKH